MIDDISILLSTIICLFILFRAVRMDRSRPWFEAEDSPPRPDVKSAYPDPFATTHARAPWE